MNGWNKVLAAIDGLFGFPNRTASKVKTLQQGFDNRTQEHVVWLEYRARVSNTHPPRFDPLLVEAGKRRRKSLLRELLAQTDSPN